MDDRRNNDVISCVSTQQAYSDLINLISDFTTMCPFLLIGQYLFFKNLYNYKLIRDQKHFGLDRSKSKTRLAQLTKQFEWPVNI